MEEQLVSFDIAKLAKEKGFYDSVNYCFAEINMKIKSEVNLLKYPPYGCSKDWKVMIYNGREQEIILRPTQSLLQRWLREIHGIHIVIIPTVTSFWTYKTVTVISERGDDVIKGIKSVSDLPPYKEVCGYDFNTYEDALEDALFESLKLI